MSSSVASSTATWRYKERKINNNKPIHRSSYVDHLFYDDDDTQNENEAIPGKRRLSRKVPFVLGAILLVCLALFYLLWNENGTVAAALFERTSAQPASGNATMMMLQPLQQEKELLVEPEWERAKGVLYKETTDALALHKLEESNNDKKERSTVARQQGEGYDVEVPKDSTEKELLIQQGGIPEAPPSPIDHGAYQDDENKDLDGRKKKLRAR